MTGILEGSTPGFLGRIVACFRRERVSYALIGAWALSVWGTSRATNDVDFLVLVDEEELSRLSDRMTHAGFDLDEAWMKWNPLLKGFQLRFQFHGTTVDLLRPRDEHDHKDQIIPAEWIEKSIFLIRGQKVMLDANLAELYEVPTKVFNQAVKRNRGRFPADFMFQLTNEEFAALRSQIVTLETGRGHAFQCSTE